MTETISTVGAAQLTAGDSQKNAGSMHSQSLPSVRAVGNTSITTKPNGSQPS